MTNYEVLKKLGLNLSPAGIAELMANADIICGHNPAEGNRCTIHNGMCDECVPAWLEEEASPSMLKLLDEEDDEPEIIRNKAKCLLCGDIIESTHRHDFKMCSCGALSVDGGLDYIRRVFKSEDAFEELSEYKK